jgi:predicted TIM-barrel enzyme
LDVVRYWRSFRLQLATKSCILSILYGTPLSAQAISIEAFEALQQEHAMRYSQANRHHLIYLVALLRGSFGTLVRKSNYWSRACW